jgi:uncharacterized membrane protein
MKTNQNVLKNVIGGSLYLNTWVWTVSSNYDIRDIYHTNWLLVITSIMILRYLFVSDSVTDDKEIKRMYGRTAGLLLIFANLIFIAHMEIRIIHVFASTVFIVLIIVISLSYKKYGLQHDETNSN